MCYIVFVLILLRLQIPTPLFSSAASDLYKSQAQHPAMPTLRDADCHQHGAVDQLPALAHPLIAVSYTHPRAHENKANHVCRILHETKTKMLRKQLLLIT